MVHTVVGKPAEKSVCGCVDAECTNAKFFSDAILLSWATPQQPLNVCSFALTYNVHVLQPDLTEIYFTQRNECD